VRKRLSIVLTVILTLTLLLTSIAFAGGGKNEIALAQEAGQAWLDSMVELTDEPLGWIDAQLTAPQVCYDLKGKPSAYMFAIENDGEVVGYIIVGSSDYGYPIFEAADVPPPSIPSTNEVKSTLERDLGLKVAKIGNPTRLLYLGFDHLFAVYEAGQQEVAVNMIFDFAIPAANLKSAMASPEDYKAAKEATREANSELLRSSTPQSNDLPMNYYCWPQEQCWCGPASGVSIGRYYKTRSPAQYGNNYPDLPGDLGNPGDPNDDDFSCMYFCLFDLMGADDHGGPIYPWNYGPGFVGMTQDSDHCEACGACGNSGDWEYTNFSYSVDYWNIVNAIEDGWPTALCAARFNEDVFGWPNWPPPGGHCVAIRGYYYWEAIPQYLIECTDSYSHANQLYLDWDHMTIGLPPTTITIKD
jgi:hypothetical protein